MEAVLVTVMEDNLKDDMEDDERLCGRQLQSYHQLRDILVEEQSLSLISNLTTQYFLEKGRQPGR